MTVDDGEAGPNPGDDFGDRAREAADEFPDWADLGYDYCSEHAISRDEIGEFAERTYDWAIEQGFDAEVELVTSAAVYGCMEAIR